MKEIYTLTLFIIFFFITVYYYKDDENFLYKITGYIIGFTILMMFFKFTKDLGDDLEEKNIQEYMELEEMAEEEQEKRRQEKYNEITADNVIWKIRH